MDETLRIWVEIGFNVTYLLTIWVMVLLMIVRRSCVHPGDRCVARLWTLAFALLAAGDTGHVGFRVIAYALGGLDASSSLFGASIGWVGLGALSTAVTVTLFYVVLLWVWRERFDRPFAAIGKIGLGAAVVRLVLMGFPQNAWQQPVPPRTWSLVRNAPLVVLGLSTAYLMLRDARASGDRIFAWIGGLILVSYVFYAPVILLVQQIPWVGMLMIPKTLAYVVMAWVGYQGLYTRTESADSGSRISTRSRTRAG
jgi:hypothetical protein